MSDLDKELKIVRTQLDELDERLVRLINDRARLVQRIGSAKAQAGVRVYVPDRERQVLDRIRKLNTGPLDDRAVHLIYRELMSASLVLEKSPRIAILGPEGSYSHLAGRRKFGLSVEFEPVATIAAVFDEVQRRRADYGLVPVENSIAGGIGETMDALIERDVIVCGEVNLAVHHHLLGLGSIDSIQHVYSKPEVFAQCGRWLSSTGLIGKTVPVSSSSVAAEKARDEPGGAAIASELAAELFELNRIAEYVEDQSGNVTRFLILGTTPTKPTAADKTNIVFGVGHQPGQLVVVLDVLRQAGLNMTRIESRPDKRQKWQYFFLVDFEGHQDQPLVADALRDIEKRCSFLKILGSYPRADEVL